MTSQKGCWIARQALGTDASSLAIASNNAVSIGSAGIGIAHSSTCFNTALVGISSVARAAVALLAIARHVTVSVTATRTRLAQLNRNGWLFANSEGISNLVIRTIADGLTRGVTDGASAARIRFARIDRLDAATNSVGTFHIAGQAGALRETVAENSALRVGTTRRRLAWICWKLARYLWRLTFVFGQAEANGSTVNPAAARVWSTWIGCALISLRNCK